MKRTLEKLAINRSRFYEWYVFYQEDEYEDIINQSSYSRKISNRMLYHIHQQIVNNACEDRGKSIQKLAWYLLFITIEDIRIIKNRVIKKRNISAFWHDDKHLLHSKTYSCVYTWEVKIY